MTYPRRTYPHGDIKLCALDQDWWSATLDSSQKVAVYWPSEGNTVTVVGYYDTVSAANTAAAAARNALGAYPRVRVNWYHSDISHIASGPVQHPDSREDLPAWIDADPAY
jgi:hypothetical protein